MQDNFYVTLPSNSSLDHYPENTMTHYTVKLSKPLVLDGGIGTEYEVALVEIKFARIWHNIVDNEDGRISVISDKKKFEMEFYVPPDVYATGEQLATSINDEIEKYFWENSSFVRDNVNYQSVIRDLSELDTIIKEQRSLVKSSRKEIARMERVIGDMKADFVEKKLLNRAMVEKHLVDDRARVADLQPYIELIAVAIQQNKSEEYIAYLQRLSHAKLSDNDRISAREKADIVRVGTELMALQKKGNQLVEEAVEAKKKLDNLKKEWFKKRLELPLLQKQRHGLVLSIIGLKNTRWIVYRKADDMFEFHLPPGISVHFSNTLARMLGLKKQELISSETIQKSKIQADFTSALTTLFVYLDCVEYQFVGNKLVPLIRAVHVGGRDKGAITKMYTKPFYCRVSRQFIQEIEVDIRDTLGRSVHFASGDDTVVVTLHFRPKKVS